MDCRGKHLIIAVTLTALDVAVASRYGIVIWQAYAGVIWSRLLLLSLTGGLGHEPGRFVEPRIWSASTAAAPASPAAIADPLSPRRPQGGRQRLNLSQTFLQSWLPPATLSTQ